MTENNDTDIPRIHRLVGVSNKKKLFERLAEILASVSEDLSFEKVLDSLTSRERIGSTFIGDGVAIPHCKLPIEQPFGVIVLLDEPVAYNNNNDMVSVIFGLLIPEEECKDHLPLLSDIAAFCRKDNWLQRIKSATSETQLKDILLSSGINLVPYENEINNT